LAPRGANQQASQRQPQRCSALIASDANAAGRYQARRCTQSILPAIVIILFFIGALIAAFLMLAEYAINEHSKHDLTNTIQYLWFGSHWRSDMRLANH